MGVSGTFMVSLASSLGGSFQEPRWDDTRHRETAVADLKALQRKICGFCTGGMLLTTKFLLDEGRLTTKEEIRRGLSGNLCRCTGYHGIVEAVAELAGVDG